MEEEKIVKLNEREMTKLEQLDQWLKELVFPGDVKDFIEEITHGTIGDEERRESAFYTGQHVYYITAIVRESKDDYLGCQVNARKQRAGEDWHRGNDLPDGPFNKETWNKIIYAIVNYELVKLSPFRKPDELPPDIA